MSNPTPYKPPSIDEQGGVWVWLDLPEQLSRHNDLGSDELKLRLRLHVPIEQIARDFNTSSETIRRWLRKGETSGRNNQDTSTDSERSKVG